MSGAFDDATIAPQTARGRDWPCLRQFCVFMENRVGRLNDLLRQVERHDLRVLASSVVDTVDFAVARIRWSTKPTAPASCCSSRTLPSSRTTCSAWSCRRGSGRPSNTSGRWSAPELNIDYLYPLLYRRGGRGAIAMHVDDIDQAGNILQRGATGC